MQVFDLPEDLLKHLILYLPWRDLIQYSATNKLLYKWTNKNTDTVMSKAIRSKEGFKLMKYDQITEDNTNTDLVKLKTLLSRHIYRPINSRWMEIKECGDRLYLMNYVIEEELRVWSPLIPTHAVATSSEYWIANCRCARNSKWSDRDFNPMSSGHNTLAHMIQNITTMIRDTNTGVCSVIVVGSPYKEWDTTPPTPLRALKNVKIYAKRNEATGTYGRNGFKRQKIGRDVHIPTEYVDRINKKTVKSFHALQSMKLNKGKECRVRIGFNLYRHQDKRWEWYIRCVFDRIQIYVT